MSQHDHDLDLTVDYPADFDVRHFRVREALHELYRVELEVVSPDITVDLDELVGKRARFWMKRSDTIGERSWSGLVTDCSHVGVDTKQLGTYRIVIHPTMWLLTQRRNYRIFQHLSDPASAQKVLADWGLVPRVSYDASLYPGRKYRVQYAESDYQFVSRLLEDAGITFYFEDAGDDNVIVFDDAPHAGPLRDRPLAYESSPTGGILREIAREVRVVRKLRPGRYTQRDVDYRRSPEFPLVASSGAGTGVEQRLERFHQNYGAFLFSAKPDGSSPVADDHGAARTQLDVGERQVARRLAAKRSDARRCLFETTAHDLRPGLVFHFGDHPRDELAEGKRLLVVQTVLSGKAVGDWKQTVDATFADQPYHPPLRTRKPTTFGVESATVVGPDDDEIHTDEFARVRVQFHWDREGQRDPRASCWIPVSQPWGGAGFGAVNIPRVGQEVLVDFLGADPDRPVIVGRVFTKTNPVPYKLPDHKTVSGIRSRSANRMVMGAADGVEGVTPGAQSVADSLAAQLTPPDFALGPTQIAAALEGNLFKAVSPNSETHRWPGSEVTMDDRLGQEVLYMQAERDMNVVVKNNQTAVIGNRRAVKVGTDDVLDVDHQQFTKVGADRLVKVEATQSHVVTGDVMQQSTEGSQHFVAKEAFTTTSKVQVHTASETIVFNVGESTLFMRPDFVILQTPKLFMNPGPEALQLSIATGEGPLDPDQAAAEIKAQAMAAFDARLDSALAPGELRANEHGSDIQSKASHMDGLPDVPGESRSDLTSRWIDKRRREYFPQHIEREIAAGNLPAGQDWAFEQFNNGGLVYTPLGPPPGG